MTSSAQPSPMPDEQGGAGQAVPHESARLHVSGQAPYTDDIPEVAGTLHAALGLSPVAHGRLLSINVEALAALPGVVAVLTAQDFAGVNHCGPIVHDEPILAEGTVHHVGQPVLVIVATQRSLARRAAAQAGQHLHIETLPALLTPQAAHDAGQYVLPPMHLHRRVQTTSDDLPAPTQSLHVDVELGGQEHFYLEGQVSYAIPQENAGMLVYCSTQHPSEMQHVVAHVLQARAHQVQVVCRRMGGGFGGKESQSALFACVAARAAQHLNRPVKLRLDRDDDMQITGHRHGFMAHLDLSHDAQGRIHAVNGELISRAGFSADLSGPVMTRALCHLDNAYWLPQVDVRGYCARTNTQSNTAFRGFGGPQGAFAIEYAIDTLARRLGKDPLDVRLENLYGVNAHHITPYGQVLADNVMRPLLDELVSSADYRARRQQVQQFNASSPVLRKGLAITPVKFGISFNVVHLNQAGALVHVFNDGSVLVNHGGTEMGQGLNTKVAQVVASTLGVRLARVRVSATDTHKVANTSATAASTGSDLNGKAAEQAAQIIRQRLSSFLASQHGVTEDQVVIEDDAAQVNGQCIPFDQLAGDAYAARVQLWSDGFYATPGLSWHRDTMQGNPFYYFAYGAAVSEVLVDTLTGEWKLLRADVLHDVGQSINPALDIGQIEGGFIQGMGWLTTEELWWHPSHGRLMTHAPSTYKIPTASDCPADFRVKLFHNQNVQDTVHRSKAVGEPPLLLAFSVFFAIRDAVASLAAASDGLAPPLRAPATPEAILDAVDATLAARDTGAASPASATQQPG